jgi:hypothetical protein
LAPFRLVQNQRPVACHNMSRKGFIVLPLPMYRPSTMLLDLLNASTLHRTPALAVFSPSCTVPTVTSFNLLSPPLFPRKSHPPRTSVCSYRCCTYGGLRTLSSCSTRPRRQLHCGRDDSAWTSTPQVARRGDKMPYINRTSANICPLRTISTPSVRHSWTHQKLSRGSILMHLLSESRVGSICMLWR